MFTSIFYQAFADLFSIERSYGDDEEDDGNSGSGSKAKSKAPEKQPDSKLVKPLQDFVKIVFNSE
jgi:hypothetical protein